MLHMPRIRCTHSINCERESFESIKFIGISSICAERRNVIDCRLSNKRASTSQFGSVRRTGAPVSNGLWMAWMHRMHCASRMKIGKYWFRWMNWLHVLAVDWTNVLKWCMTVWLSITIWCVRKRSSHAESTFFLVFLLSSFSKDVSCGTRTHRTPLRNPMSVQWAIALKDTICGFVFPLAFANIKNLVRSPECRCILIGAKYVILFRQRDQRSACMALRFWRNALDQHGNILLNACQIVEIK